MFALSAGDGANRVADQRRGSGGNRRRRRTNEATSALARFQAQQARDLANSVAGNAALVNDVGGGGRTSGRYAGPSYTGRIGPGDEVTGAIRGHDFARTGRLLADLDSGAGRSVYPGEPGYDAAKDLLSAPAAQHGAAVRGSRYGSLVRVGENFTNENITPVGRNGGGSGRNQGGRREYPIYIGDEKLTTLVLNAQNELVDTGRA